MGIRETLRQDLAKLVMRAARDQAKTASVNLQLCAGIKAGIEGETHTVGQRRRERTAGSRIEEESVEETEYEEDKEDTGEGLIVETGAT